MEKPETDLMAKLEWQEGSSWVGEWSELKFMHKGPLYNSRDVWVLTNKLQMK